ncbi:MAG: hypothetical protein WBX11_04105 [Thiobacillaceae bacterium]
MQLKELFSIGLATLALGVTQSSLSSVSTLFGKTNVAAAAKPDASMFTSRGIPGFVDGRRQG